MSSSVFTENPSAKPTADGDANLVVVYSKNGISFDERGIEKIMEEKSISTIAVVRLTSPTPSMMDEEEAERLEELERFNETATDREDSDRDSAAEEGSQSGGDEVKSEKDHITGDDNEEQEEAGGGAENNDDSTETEAEATAKVKKRPGRKPKVVKKQKKRRKPKERPQIIGLSVEQFYTDNSADLVVKNALKMAGMSIFKRTAETDALMEIIRNDHNYTPYTSPEQMKAQKNAEKLAADRQAAAQGRKYILQTPATLLTAKKRLPVVPLSQVRTLPQQQQQKLLPQTPQQPKLLPQQQQPKPQQLPKPQPKLIAPPPNLKAKRPVKVEDFVEDDEDANSSINADDENADKSYDTEELEQLSDELSDASRETDNDRDSDIDFKMNNSRNATNKRKRVKKTGLSKRSAQPKPPSQPAPQFAQLKRRKRSPERGAIAVKEQVATPAASSLVEQPMVIAFGRARTAQNAQFLKVRTANKSLPIATASAESPRLATPSPSSASKLRRTPIVEVASAAPAVAFLTPPQDVKEIVINKNMASPKGQFTNLNTLLSDSHSQNKAKPSFTITQLIPAPKTSASAASAKGFMPIGVETAATHKLPAQIVIETHQSSSELAAENDKQLDLINSIVQDELLKTSSLDSVEQQQPAINVDENIPKLVKMLESTAAGLNQTQDKVVPTTTFESSLASSQAVELAEPDEDEITADFLQHVVGLIEEDKQFEAEVVKQVLASVEPGASIDAIANVVNDPMPIFAAQSLANLSSNVLLPDDALQGIVADQAQPMACSTPSRMLLERRPPEVKIVRGNGRVIYLPPIEAPTTRAKRRAQNTSSTDVSGNQSSLQETTLPADISLLSSASLGDSDSFQLQQQPPQSSNMVKRQKTPGSRRSAVTPRRSKKLNASLANNDTEASESQEDDDDPKKLWCICRQPHNNRFMICCDLCEDWYHGTCVSVTKAMGLEMEQKGIDWKCPKCVKQLEEKNQPRITDMLANQKSLTAQQETFATIENASVIEIKPHLITPQSQEEHTKSPLPKVIQILPMAKQQTLPLKRPTDLKLQPHKLMQPQLNFIKLGPAGSSESSGSCILCKRSTMRSSSVYCSDECIRKYAQSAIQTQTTAKSPEIMPAAVGASAALGIAIADAKKSKRKDLFEDVLRQADTPSKIERINVFERRSGRFVTGHNAPTVQQLKKFLQDNPSFEVLQPGSPQALELERRQLKRAELLLSPSADSHSPSKMTVLNAAAQSPTLLRQGTTGSPSPSKAANRPIPKTKEKLVNVRRNPLDKSQTESPPIRLNVRRTLKEQLIARIKEAQQAELETSKQPLSWLSAEEVENFAKNVETEMFQSFGRDVGAKYKSKYRSLMFNIKDRKNKTLFDKICAKQVEPKQLVRMTPAELASQELAKWREEENRHQLDIIKKSELDLLSCSQNYVVKTHKGEELIESNVDALLPEESASLEQAPTQLNEAAEMSSKELESTKMSNLDYASSTEKSETPLRDKKKGKSGQREKDRSRERDKERDKRHKSHKHHHQSHHQSSSAKRSRSRSNSRSRSLEKRHRHERHHNEHSDRARSKETETLLKKATEKQPPAPAKAFSLVDQILESEKTVEQAANLMPKAAAAAPPAAVPAPAAIPVPHETLDKYERYLQTLPKSALWSGALNMVDIANFHVVIHAVHGNTHQLPKLLSSKLDVIGRITRVNVWDYMKKIKKSPTKEIVIVNLFPSSGAETDKFKQFFDYLDSRQRLGVLASDSEAIRDFYIFPLGAREKLPSVLHTVERVPFYEDTHRPDTLLGIIVRCLGKRAAAPTVLSNQPTAAMSTPTASSMATKKRVPGSFTPPGSPKRKHSTHSNSSKDDEFDIDAIIKAPIASKAQQSSAAAAAKLAAKDDPNAPYSPGGGSSDDELPTSTTTNKDDLKRQVDEIDKEIAARQMEIASLFNVEKSLVDKPTSSSNLLSKISIPPNLSMILASIKDNTEMTAKALPSRRAADEEYNPEDAISSSNSYAMAKKLSEKSSTKSRLAQLSEAELLSMVPDDLMLSATPTSASSSNRYEEPPPPGV